MSDRDRYITINVALPNYVARARTQDLIDHYTEKLIAAASDRHTDIRVHPDYPDVWIVPAGAVAPLVGTYLCTHDDEDYYLIPT